MSLDVMLDPHFVLHENTSQFSMGIKQLIRHHLEFFYWTIPISALKHMHQLRSMAITLRKPWTTVLSSLDSSAWHSPRQEVSVVIIALHGCHCRGDMAVHMRKVVAILRSWYVCSSAKIEILFHWHNFINNFFKFSGPYLSLRSWKQKAWNYLLYLLLIHWCKNCRQVSFLSVFTFHWSQRMIFCL